MPGAAHLASTGAAPSQVVAVDVFALDIPFDDRSEGTDAPPGRWDRFETVLVRVTTADGLEGWGESFAYGCLQPVVAALRTMVAPLLVGADADDVPALMRTLQHRLHIFGRYGIAMFALSGVDIALWDRRGKVAGKPVAALLGAAPPRDLPAYASLVHYGTPAAVRTLAGRAAAEGFASIKLHERTPETIRAGREGAGPDTHLTVDVNCGWSFDEALAMLPVLAEAGIAWLEEPLFPPEDFAALARLAAASPVPLSAGENGCTRYEFRQMLASGGVAIPQPSVTKVGGLTEAAAIVAEADAQGVACMPHSPYFGPGYQATLQLLAATPGAPMLEYAYVDPAGYVGRDTPLPRGGRIAVPDAPGIGFTPDWTVIERFAVPSGTTA